MAGKKRPVSKTEYVYGNVVRQSAEPARRMRESTERNLDKRPLHRPERGPQIRKSQVRRNQARALQMDLPYVIMLTLAAIIVMGICLNYLRIQSSIMERTSKIQEMEQKLENLKTENDVLENRINTSVDLDEVYKIATEELGMVYANKNQVILYDRTESEYVRQDEDIPQY